MPPPRIPVLVLTYHDVFILAQDQMIHTFEVGEMIHPTNRTVDEHRTWEDQGFFCSFWGAMEFMDRSPGVHGPKKDWDDLNEAFFLGHFRGPGVRNSKISKTELLVFE